MQTDPPAPQPPRPFLTPTGPTEPDTAVIFLHNLKTGGSTLRSILARQYRAGQICILGRQDDPSAIKPAVVDDPRLRLIEGHVPFGLHRLISRPATYISLLREPVERIVSLYSFILRGPDREISREVADSVSSLEAFVSSGTLLELDNGQTRRLSGSSPPYGECSEAMLEAAKANIREHFAVVGLTERFDESVLLMRRRFGWTSVLYLSEKVNSRREPVEAFPSSTIRLIEERNRFDRALYDYAAALFEEQLAQQEADFQTELASLRWLNQELAEREERRKQIAWSLRRGGRAAAVVAAPTTDPLGMLLDAHAGVLAAERDTLALMREFNAARRRLRVLEAEREEFSTLVHEREAVGEQARALTLRQKLDVERERIRELAQQREAERERIRTLAQERDAARERARALESSKLWRLRTWYRRAGDRIANTAPGRGTD